MPIVLVSDGLGKKHQVDSSNLIPRKAVYGLYLKNNNLLMVKDKVSNKWELPGGGINKNESLLKALKREFFEETGLTLLDSKVSPDMIVCSFSELFFDIDSNEAWKTKRIFFSVSEASGLLITKGNNIDIKQAKFFPFNKLPFSLTSQTINIVLHKFRGLYKMFYN